MAEEEQEWAKLPLEDRTQHKAWKARVSGYEEAIKKFPTWDSDDAAQWKKVRTPINKSAQKTKKCIEGLIQAPDGS